MKHNAPSFKWRHYGPEIILLCAGGNTTAGMEGSNPTISTANNHISKAGYEYDAVGNMTRDELDHTYGYDAENRLKSFDGGVGAIYTFDGEGRRVKKVVGIGLGDSNLSAGTHFGEYVKPTLMAFVPILSVCLRLLCFLQLRFSDRTGKLCRV